MKIICIAWGSLIWRPGQLVLASDWHAGGPLLPLEFARDSDDSDELALVLCNGAAPVPTYWARMATDDLDVAKAQLQQREKIAADRPEWVGCIGAAQDRHDAVSDTIGNWLAAHDADCAIWTAIPPKFHHQNGRVPTEAEAIAFLTSLRGEARVTAEDYIRRVPADIMTAYRVRFGELLHWTPLPCTA
ncbi:hypothetical protein [Duganella sp. Leaf126]|uniref:hypothetical protein n=1 Tax=Duganella sp. Leaf126 TaxID=1736266 RepID=UPI0012E1C55B|nr:hypothetical protein [Duganella sp. Leaf126]